MLQRHESLDRNSISAWRASTQESQGFLMQMVLMIFDPLCNLLKIQLDEIRNGNLDDSYVASGQIGRTCFCADPKFLDATPWGDKIPLSLCAVSAQVTGSQPAVSLEVATAPMTSQDRFYLTWSAP